jgi:hypothetical protein
MEWGGKGEVPYNGGFDAGAWEAMAVEDCGDAWRRRRAIG